MRFVRLCLAAAVVMLGHSGSAGAVTDWPDFQAHLSPDVANSPRLAALPEGLRVIAPGLEVPRSRAAFSGLWSGWLCREATFDVELAVTRVGEGAATLVFAGASAERAPFSERAEGRFEDGELLSNLKDGWRLALARRVDGNLDIKLVYPGNPARWCTGILAKAELGPTVDERRRYVRPTSRRVETALIEAGAPVRLEMVTYRPAGEGPFPLLLFNHGSTGSGRSPGRFKITRWHQSIGQLFAQNGWMVVMPQRRGRGNSDGQYDEGFHRDRSKGYTGNRSRTLRGARRALEDLAAALDAVTAWPEVDARRIVIGGNSRGGILSIAYAGQHPKQVRGVLNFVGGWLNGDRATALEVHKTLVRDGAAFARPTLWLYGARDPLYSLDHMRAVYGTFRAAGGAGSFRAFEVPHGSAHNLVVWPSLWRRAVADYLEEIGLTLSSGDP